MRQWFLHSSIFVALALNTAWAGDAPAVYRCGSSYSQTPCPDGVRVEVHDNRTDDQKRQADAITLTRQKSADALEHQRNLEEAKRAEQDRQFRDAIHQHERAQAAGERRQKRETPKKAASKSKAPKPKTQSSPGQARSPKANSTRSATSKGKPATQHTAVKREKD